MGSLPMFDPKQRDLEHVQTLDSGKLTWTFFVDTAQYSGPIKAYVPSTGTEELTDGML